MENQKEIKTGTFNAKFPIEHLKQSLVNRDIVSKHSDLFGKKISAYGWLSPIIIDEKGNIIEGHHRVISAERMNLKTVPAYIVDWVDTKNLDEYQKYIISLNNSNRKWGALDYLKSYSRNKADYRFVFNKYVANKDTISVGNTLNLYFGSGVTASFKDGESEIKNKDFSNFLLKNILSLKKDFGSKKIQAYTVRALASFANSKLNQNKEEAQLIFNEIRLLAEVDSPVISSIEHILPFLNKKLTEYRNR